MTAAGATVAGPFPVRSGCVHRMLLPCNTTVRGGTIIQHVRELASPCRCQRLIGKLEKLLQELWRLCNSTGMHPYGATEVPGCGTDVRASCRRRRIGRGSRASLLSLRVNTRARSSEGPRAVDLNLRVPGSGIPQSPHLRAQRARRSAAGVSAVRRREIAGVPNSIPTANAFMDWWLRGATLGRWSSRKSRGADGMVGEGNAGACARPGSGR